MLMWKFGDWSIVEFGVTKGGGACLSKRNLGLGGICRTLVLVKQLCAGGTEGCGSSGNA